jgi:predicted enzyme related to lactoylglutathione lyase
MANQVVHFEIIGSDGSKLRDFYRQAFGWEYQTVGGPMDYALVQNAGIGGGCDKTDGHVRVYVAVDDINAALRKVQSLGARSVEGPFPIPTGGQIAQFVDPQGQSIGLVQQ